MVYGNRSRIYRRMMEIVAAAIILCIALCGSSVYLYMVPMVRSSLVEKNRSMILKMSEQVANSLEEIIWYEENISFDETVQTSLKRINELEKGSYRYYSSIQTLERKLGEYKLLRDRLILDIFAVDTDGNALEVSYRYKSLVQETNFANAIARPAGGSFFPADNVNYYGISGGERNTLAYVNRMYDKERVGNELGTLVILMDQEKLTAPLQFDGDEVRIELHSGDGTLIYSNAGADAGEEWSGGQYEREEIGEKGWYICYQITTRDIPDTIKQISWTVTGIAGIILLVMLVLFILMVRRMAHPLEILIQGVQKVAAGNQDEKIRIHTGDECEMVANLFNSMIDRIHDSTEKLLESEQKRYESQLEMLSYQLNPHFIYNTLNAIICLARRQDYEEVIHLTRVFMTILRAILQIDLQTVGTIEEEKTFIDSYVEVLQICYQNVPNVQWEIPQELDTLVFPRLLLYPLVENSVFHGILPGDGASLLKISVFPEQNWIRVSVEDDGAGCGEERLEEIREALKQGERKGHIGLYNVNERLKLIYPECSPLRIDNRKGGGTRISFAFLRKAPVDEKPSAGS